MVQIYGKSRATRRSWQYNTLKLDDRSSISMGDGAINLYSTVVDPGGERGVQMHPPFEGLPSRVLSKSAQT